MELTWQQCFHDRLVFTPKEGFGCCHKTIRLNRVAAYDPVIKGKVETLYPNSFILTVYRIIATQAIVLSMYGVIRLPSRICIFAVPVANSGCN